MKVEIGDAFARENGQVLTVVENRGRGIFVVAETGPQTIGRRLREVHKSVFGRKVR